MLVLMRAVRTIGNHRKSRVAYAGLTKSLKIVLNRLWKWNKIPVVYSGLPGWYACPSFYKTNIIMHSFLSGGETGNPFTLPNPPSPTSLTRKWNEILDTRVKNEHDVQHASVIDIHLYTWLDRDNTDRHRPPTSVLRSFAYVTFPFWESKALNHGYSCVKSLTLIRQKSRP